MSHLMKMDEHEHGPKNYTDAWKMMTVILFLYFLILFLKPIEICFTVITVVDGVLFYLERDLPL